MWGRWGCIGDGGDGGRVLAVGGEQTGYDALYTGIIANPCRDRALTVGCGGRDGSGGSNGECVLGQ